VLIARGSRPRFLQCPYEFDGKPALVDEIPGTIVVSRIVLT
jgi:hypothetical protein